MTKNFCIIAHIDHGKSTLADRFLEITGTIEKSRMHEQMLDSMDLERERGITIKLQPVRMVYKPDGQRDPVILNLIDTPGHVDFGYEVSRSLAAVEGAVLLVDATQGIQAQTLANLHIARQHNLTIIPVVNKIDLPNAEPERVTFELADLLHCDPAQVVSISAKTGQGVEDVIAAIIARVPSPAVKPNEPLQALIFDSIFNTYRGVITHIRIMAGTLKSGDKIQLMATGQTAIAEEVGYIAPNYQAADTLTSGDIGYIVTGLKQVGLSRVGDTITLVNRPATQPLLGYQIPQPMVFASLFEASGDTVGLRDSLEKLALNDASLQFTPTHSDAFGAGFRCGFLGLLHLEIVKERVEREFHHQLIITTPSVAFRGDALTGYEEPWAKVEVVTPSGGIGAALKLFESTRGVYQSITYFGEVGLASAPANQTHAIITYDVPLADIIIDFNDRLKSVSSGYASFSYAPIGYRPGKLVQLDILVNGEKVPPFSQFVPEENAYEKGRIIAERLKELIPRQLFEVSIQAVIGGKIIARETVSALRKDVTAKLYGGDVTRKRKLLDKQKHGKQRMKEWGRVSIPTQVFLEVLKPKLGGG